MTVDLREMGGGGEGVDWIRLALDSARWRALVNTVIMNLSVP
jgi:hypothetical protein